MCIKLDKMKKLHNKSYLFLKEHLKKLQEDPHSAVVVQKQIDHLSLYPYHLTDITKSVKELLENNLAKYNKRLGAILLGYQNLKILDVKAPINFDSCFIHVDVEADFFLFQPKIGDVLTGIVNKKSGLHVGGLIHQMFNVSMTNPDEDDETWLGHKAKIGQEIQFKIILARLDDRLPYIQAELLSIISEDSGFSTGEDISPQKSTKKRFNSEGESTNENKETEKIDETDGNNESIHKKKKKKKSKHKEVEEEPIKSSLTQMVDDLVTKKEKKKKKKKDEIDLNLTDLFNPIKTTDNILENELGSKKKRTLSTSHSMSKDHIKLPPDSDLEDILQSIETKRVKRKRSKSVCNVVNDLNELDMKSEKKRKRTKSINELKEDNELDHYMKKKKRTKSVNEDLVDSDLEDIMQLMAKKTEKKKKKHDSVSSDSLVIDKKSKKRKSK